MASQNLGRVGSPLEERELPDAVEIMDPITPRA
jgi:hypothetical protein